MHSLIRKVRQASARLFYRPIVVGVLHSPRHLGAVKAFLSANGRKGIAVAVEATPAVLRSGQKTFFKEVADHASGLGMRVLPIDSRFAWGLGSKMDWLLQSEPSFPEPRIEDVPENKYVRSKDAVRRFFPKWSRLSQDQRAQLTEYVTAVLRSRSFVRRCLKHRPDIVIVGVPHPQLMAAELKARKYVQIPEELPAEVKEMLGKSIELARAVEAQRREKRKKAS